MFDFTQISRYRENNRLEAKLATGGLPHSIWETYSAFANSYGGVILLGVEELPDHSLRVQGLLDPQGMVEEVEMKPGELLRYDRGTGTLSVKSVDTRQYVAWKDGYFAFEDATLEEIMQKLALWYNVEVFFQSEEAKRFVFTGFMRKYEQIDTILAAVRDVTGVRYSISGRTVVISR